jgi:hypothetical protein
MDAENYKIVHFIDLNNCVSCAAPLLVSDGYADILTRNCSYIVPNYNLPNNNEMLARHLTEKIVKNSTLLSSQDLYYYYKQKYMPGEDSFILIFNETDSLLFRTLITREGIAEINEIMRMVRAK